jgi:transcriptional regulator with XRE-family HTH domain
MAGAPAATGMAARVRAARERRGWRREALAVRSGISWSGIAQIEAGRRTNVRPATLSALAAALGVSTDYLVHGGPASPAMLEHSALLYGSDEEFVGTAGPFLAEGVERSEAVLAVTTRSNIELLRAHLGPDAKHVEFAEAEAWYSTPAAALASYQAFANARLESGFPWLRAIGEPVWAGRSDSEIRLWTRYEALLNLVFAGWPATIRCPYDERSLQPEIARQARLTHPHTVERGGIVTSPDYADPSGFVLGPA